MIAAKMANGNIVDKQNIQRLSTMQFYSELDTLIKYNNELKKTLKDSNEF